MWKREKGEKGGMKKEIRNTGKRGRGEEKEELGMEGNGSNGEGKKGKEKAGRGVMGKWNI